MTSPFDAVSATLQIYFDALHFCDLSKLEVAFHPKAVYATADATPPLIRDMKTYFAVVAEREPPAARKEQRRDAVDAIEFAGANTAFARVRCSIADRDFVDFLTLIRVEGRWRIIAKVFQIAEPVAEKEGA